MARPTFENFKKEALSNPKVMSEYNKLKKTQQLRMTLIKMRKSKQKIYQHSKSGELK